MSRVVVGLTGPIGSGKSAVAQIFCDNGYKLVDADNIARLVVQKGSDTLSLLADAFGAQVINSDGTLNRQALASVAFSSAENTEKLNSITHPAILSMVKAQIAQYTAENATKIIYDAPLLFESGSDALCDVVVSVVAPVDLRIARVSARDNMEHSEILKRINAQHPDEFYTHRSDYVVENSADMNKLITDTKKVLAAIDEVFNGTI